MDTNKSVLEDTKTSILSLIHKLVTVNSTTEEIRMRPSAFMKEMKLTTEERLEKLNNSTFKQTAMTTSKSRTFIPTPELLIFQNYKPNVAYTASFAMRNNSTMPRPLRAIFPKSPYFTLSNASPNVGMQVAPGISVIFNVRFLVDEVKDYKYDVTFETENETILFSIYAVSPRPLLELPDTINLSTTAIRVPKENCLYVRNTGKVQANLLASTNPPFSVNLDKGILLPNDMMKLVVTFNPEKLGQAEGILTIAFETGETLAIDLTGISKNANIKFEKGALRFRKTFIGLTRQRTLMLLNNSKHNVEFRWKLHRSKEEENANVNKIKDSLKYMQVNETIRSNKLERLQVIDVEGHKNVYERIYEDELQELAMQDQYPYQNPYFQILPATGNVHANKSLEFVIIFSPTYVGNYNTHAFLDITGRDSRLPLIINGTGIGPNLELNMESLEVKKLFMCASHQYEVVVVNKGDIPGTVSFPEQEMEFGGNLSCEPSFHSLDPNECGRFNLKFSSKQQGQFFEEIYFHVDESSEKLRLIFTGEIICPYLELDVTEINFENVPIGYPKRKRFNLSNNSMVPVEYKFFVYGDGDIPSVTCKEYASCSGKCGLPKHPKEFDYSSRCGFVPPHSSITVVLTLTANIVRHVQTSLLVRMWGTDRHTISIPIIYNAQTPTVVCMPQELNIKFCYLTYPYYRNITLRNESKLPGYFELSLPEESEMGGIQCVISKTEVFIKPYENVEIYVVVKTNYIGEDRIPIFITLLGGTSFQCCTIICRGQGPVISVDVEELNFGKIRMLTEVQEVIKITNDSPISAFITLSTKGHSYFKVEPTELVLSSQQVFSAIVSVCLSDPIRASDKLTVSAEQGNELFCMLKAVGFGTSIACEPALEPELNIGFLLTYQEFRIPISLTNKGLRNHKIMFTRTQYMKTLKEESPNMKCCFSFLPNVLDLNPHDRVISIIRCYSPKLGPVREDYYCFASINNSNSAENIMSFNVIATFVEPDFEISKKEIRFERNFATNFFNEFTRDDLVITNKTPIPISVNIVSEHPFYVENSGKSVLKLPLSLNHEESYQIFVNFLPDNHKNRCYIVRSKLILDYSNHPKKDFIILTAEVNYPTIELLPKSITFPCLPPGAIHFQELVLKNVSILPVSYYFEWLETSFSTAEIKETEIMVLKKKEILIEIDNNVDSDSDDVSEEKVEVYVTKASEVTVRVDIEQLEDKGRLPVVHFYHWAYRIAYPQYHYVQVLDVLKQSISMEDSIMIPEPFLQRFADMRSLLYGIICNDEEDVSDNDVFNVLSSRCPQRHVNQEAFDVTPTRGVLNPFESQTITIAFRPIREKIVTAEVVCHVDGGDSEYINMVGKSCSLSYSIETLQIDFGRQIFCEINQKTITLKNTCLMSFSFSTSANDIPKYIPSTLVLEAGGLTVTPKEANLEPGQSTQLSIQYLPGIAGEFKESFTLKIGYLPKIDINVHGYGDFPQVYLGHRTSLNHVPSDVTYSAVATITTEYLQSVRNINDTLRYAKNLERQEDLQKGIVKTLKRRGWVVISYQELYPSEMDIDMAIERMLLYHHIYNNPYVLTKHLKVHKRTSVPEFIVPEYYVNLGCVVPGEKALQKVQILNYGPTKTRITLIADIDKKLLPGLEVDPIPSENLLMGHIKQFSVIFYPQYENYKNVTEKVIYNTIYIDVAHGSKIPISIRANVTVPKLNPDCSVLNFGELCCGNLKKRAVIFENDGFVKCKWTALIQKKQKNKNDKSEQVSPKKVFYLVNNGGSVNQGGKCKLEVYFEPQVEGDVEWNLIVTIENNPNKIRISLKGLGRMPNLKISNEVVQFKPILPYAPEIEKTFWIQNNCVLPIEFYFSDFDNDIETEEKVMNLLFAFYDTNRLILPPRQPGQKLPSKLHGFYFAMREQLRKKLMSLSQITVLGDSMVKLSDENDKPVYKKKTVRPRSQVSVDMKHLESMTEIEGFEGLLKDYVRNLPLEEKSCFDPICDVITEYKNQSEKKQPPPIKEGVFIIFHGCFITNYAQAASRAGLELKIPVYSIDSLILEILAKEQNVNTCKMKDIINQEYLKRLPVNREHIKKFVEPLDELEYQMDFLSNPVESARPSSKDKKEGKKEKKPNTSTFLGIPEELIIDVLKITLPSFHDGIIIESLYSKFIPDPYLALNICLKAIGNVKYLHCIILSYSYEQYSAFDKALKKLEEEKAANMKRQKMESMIEMEPDELKNLSADDYHMFRTEFLLKRREVTAMRREALKKRLLEEKAKRKHDSKKNKKTEPPKIKPADIKKVASKISAKPSTATSGKDKKEKPPKIKEDFDKFQDQLRMILHLLENWDRKSLICTKPLTISSGAKPAKAPKTPKSPKSIATSSKVLSKISFVKPPVDFTNLTPELELKLIQNGIPCWVINDAHKHKPVQEMVANYIRYTPDFQLAVLSLQESLKEQVEEVIELRTVSYASKDVRNKNISDVFLLRNILDVPSVHSTLSKTKELEHGTNASSVSALKRRRSRSRSLQSVDGSDSKRLSQTETRSSLETDQFTERMVLCAEEKIKYRVLFKPEILGYYEHTFTLQVIGWPTKFYVTCKGVADIPKLNMTPESIFPKVMKKRTKKTQYHNNIFLSESNVFDFGPLISYGDVQSKLNSCETEFNFKNNSSLPCQTTFCIFNDESNFQFNKGKLTIAPGVTEVLHIRAMPVQTFEECEDQLIISIKDNPVIQRLNLKSETCELILTVTPKVLRFDRVLIMTNKEEIVTIHNKSLVPLCWELANLDMLLNFFKVTPISGRVEPEDIQNVLVEFYSETPKIIHKQSFIVDVYDKNYTHVSPIYTESIEITAEAMIVPIECETDLNLGEVKGQTANRHIYQMVTTGKYNVDFFFTPISRDDDPHFKKRKTLRSYFEMVPSTGVLIPYKCFDAELKFLCKTPVRGKKVPLFNVQFIDPLKKSIIKTFTLTVTFQTKFSIYELFPPEEMNFGSQLLGSETYQSLTLANHGNFEFEYSITHLVARSQSRFKDKESGSKKGSGKDTKKNKESGSKKGSGKDTKKNKESGSKKGSGKDTKKSKTEDDKKKKMKSTKLDVGCFSLVSSTGVVEPNSSATIQVSVKSMQIGHYKETVVLFITQTQEPDIHGRHFNLLVDICIPTVDFSNVDLIFREQIVVDSMGAIDKNMLADANAFYIKEDSTLYFPCKVINKEVKAQLTFKNTSTVLAELIPIIVPQNDAFSVHSKQIYIEPYAEVPVTITFTPTSINVFHGSLTISCRGADSQTNGPFSVKLLGEGIVPQISLLAPSHDKSLDCYSLSFRPTFISTSSKHSIKFENVSAIPCMVILEVCKGSLDVFSIQPHPDAEHLFKIRDEPPEVTAHTNIMSLNVDETAEFYLVFTPTSSNTFNCVVRIHTINNPYEVIDIYASGEGYDDDIMLHDLETNPIKSTTGCITGYFLDFGDVFVGKSQTRCFKISNVSDTVIYKFEFSPTNIITFMPTIGHLKPKSCKEVVVMFFSKEPLTINNEQLQCVLNQIEYADAQLEPLSWDDRQTVVVWEPSDGLSQASTITASSSILEKNMNSSQDLSSSLAIKSIKDKDEPLMELIPNTTKYIPLLVSAVCNYTSYHCSVRNIEFEDTFAFESRSESFPVVNTSNITYNLEWDIQLDTTNTAEVDIETVSISDDQLVEEFRKKVTRPICLTGKETFLTDCISSKDSNECSIFSSEGNLINYGKEISNQAVPFKISPRQVAIKPTESQIFTVTFSPQDVFIYLANLTAKIPNLIATQEKLAITVKAKSLLPLYYFDLPSSDYITTRRNTSLACNEMVSDDTAVVEFETLGTRKDIIRKFKLINPTNETHTYKWSSISDNSNNSTVFHCHCPEGTVEKGKIIEVVFSFSPHSFGTFELIYAFNIEKQNVKKFFLLVGTARQPVVHFKKQVVQIRPSVLKLDIIETTFLKNMEQIALDFKFNRESLYSDSNQQFLTVEPMKGVLPPRGEQEIRITYHPVKAGEVNFNLQCFIESMEKPLGLIVKALCYEINPEIYYDAPEKTRVYLTANKITTLELKPLMPFIQKEVIFTIVNDGKTGFYYHWSINESLLETKVNLRFFDSKGFVPVGEQVVTRITVTLLTKVVIKKLFIKLQIRYGPTYIVQLSTSIVKNLYHFSFSEYDFGPCLIQKEATSFYQVVLLFTNSDESPVTLECKQIQQDDCLTVKFSSKRILPKKPEAIEIYFHPFKIQHYSFKLLFYVNCNPRKIHLRGEGVPLSICLKNCADKFLNVGSVLVGKTKTISVPVLNNSLCPINIIFDIPERLPISKKLQKIAAACKSSDPAGKPSTPKLDKQSKKTPQEGKNKKSGGKNQSKHLIPSVSKVNVPSAEEVQRQVLSQSITVSPKKFTKVGPQQVTHFHITFSPIERLSAFTGQISYQVQDIAENLCSLVGSFDVSDFFLDKQYIPFGSVVIGYCRKQKLLLTNKGNTRGKFKWKFAKSQTNFSINPTCGHITEHSSITFTVKFKPSCVQNFLQEKLKCQITNFTKTLELTLSGSCVNMPPAIDVIQFNCCVRELEKKMIAIENISSEPRKVSAAVNGEFFYSQETYTLPGKSTSNCEVWYKPMTMTGEKTHTGSIFFAFPEGQGLLYNLNGISKPPLAIEKISLEIKSKTVHNQILEVKNWLNTPQTFEVITENLAQSKVLYRITGSTDIELLGNATRNYTWSIYALNEGLLPIKVIFKNKDTKEFLFYEISLNVLKCLSLGYITLCTSLRKPVKHSLILKNPLSNPVTFTSKGSNTELTYPTSLLVEGSCEREFTITYKPTAVGNSDVHIDIVSPELGTYPYDLNLIATSPIPEKVIAFVTKLGKTVSSTAQLTNSFKSSVTFEAEFEHPEDFYLDGPLMVPGEAVKDFCINFEPSQIGDITSSLQLFSSQTGSYLYTLKGKCEMPQPQGPYFIMPGNNTTITFKNPFVETKEFSFVTEPAIFSVKQNLYTLKGKTDVKVPVYLVPIQNLEVLIDRKYAIAGRLTVQITDKTLSHIKWVYYLHGDLDS